MAPDIPANYVGNYYQTRADTEVKYGIRALNPGTPGAGIFVHGKYRSPTMRTTACQRLILLIPNSRQFIVSKPFPAETITTTTALQAYDQVSGWRGANMGLNCDGTFFSRRDAIDTRIVNEVINGTGKIIDDPSEVGGWLTIPPATPCTDSDHDGMSDPWEQKIRLQSC